VKLRALLLALASLGIPLALATIALPMTWGYGGFSLSPATNGLFHVAYVTADSPAARAGLHRGDVVRPLKGWDEIRELGGSANTTITLRVVRDGHVTPTNVTFVRFYGPLAVQETIRKIAGSLTAIVAFGVVILCRSERGTSAWPLALPPPCSWPDRNRSASAPRSLSEMRWRRTYSTASRRPSSERPPSGRARGCWPYFRRSPLAYAKRRCGSVGSR
jgi:hypothetical protein